MTDQRDTRAEDGHVHVDPHPDDGHVHVHVHSTKFYAGILGALLVFTVLTVAASYVDIDGMLALGRPVEGVGAWNLGLAVLIATMKATLVVLFFMHLKDDSRFNGLVFIGSILFVGVFFAYTMNDTTTRGLTGDVYNGVTIDPETGERAPGGINRPIHGERLERGLVGEVPNPAVPAGGAPAVEAPSVPEAASAQAAATDAAEADELAAEEEPAAEEPAAEEPAAEELAAEEPAAGEPAAEEPSE